MSRPGEEREQAGGGEERGQVRPRETEQGKSYWSRTGGGGKEERRRKRVGKDARMG